MKATDGVIQAVYRGKRSSSLLFNNETYYVAVSGGMQKIPEDTNARIWYQIRTSLFGTRKVIYQIQVRDWLLREDYPRYHTEQMEHQQYALVRLAYCIIAIPTLLFFIWMRHKDEESEYNRDFNE